MSKKVTTHIYQVIYLVGKYWEFYLEGKFTYNEVCNVQVVEKTKARIAPSLTYTQTYFLKTTLIPHNRDIHDTGVLRMDIYYSLLTIFVKQFKRKKSTKSIKYLQYHNNLFNYGYASPFLAEREV